MANAIYTPAKDDMLGAGATRLDLDTDTIKLVGVDTADYVFSAAHGFLSDILPAARVPAGVDAAAGFALGTPSISGGAFTSAPVTMTAVTGDPFEAVVLFKFLTNDAGSRLVSYYDTFTAGMPITPNGGDITFSPHGTGWLVL